MKNYIFSSRKKLQKTRVVAVQAAYSYEINPACEDSGIYAEDFLKLYNDGQLTERPLLIQKDENIEEIDYNRESDVFNQNLIFKLKNTNEEIARILPTVDNHSQIEIRRNIFYEKLVKK